MPSVTCLEFAQIRLRNRAVKESTVRNYLQTLKVLGLSDVPYDDVTVSLCTARLARVLNPGTRRKHAINLRATLCLPVPCPKPQVKSYDLPALSDLHTAIEASSYAMYGLTMLYAGLRIGEACAKQPLNGRVLLVDRQRLQDGTITSSKTTGPVVIPDWLAGRYSKWNPNKGYNTVEIGIKRALKRAGFPLTCHSLRHAFATNLVRTGASPNVLQRQMRHHDVSVSLRYYVQTTEQDVMDAVDRLGGIQ